ncbi:unnamed protein product [Dracunculus medinensis]|uniref:Small ribosomal subunit protein bS16m n=1 Tax=Dracunculus medinensis TaxID=318479 RepID=A0A0N4UJW9_DRAME|nr:unnamed protein product [Dracunculus medinensis]
MRFAKSIGRPSIGFVLAGCRNRPFYLICVLPDRTLGRHYRGSAIEQVGCFDPLPNFRNEKLVALDIGRLKYWIGVRNANISVSVLELLGKLVGLSGLLPIHPKTYIRSQAYRKAALEAQS